MEYNQDQEQNEPVFEDNDDDDDDDDEEEEEVEEEEPLAKFEYDEDSEDSNYLSEANDDYTDEPKSYASKSKRGSAIKVPLSASQKMAAKSRKSRLDRSPTPDDAVHTQLQDDTVIVAPDTQEMPPEPSADLPRHLFNDAAVRALLTIVIAIDPFQGKGTWTSVYINYSWWSYHHIDPPRRYARMKTCMDKTFDLVKVGEKYWNQLKLLHETPGAVIENMVHFPYSKKTLNLVRTVAGMKAEAGLSNQRRRVRLAKSAAANRRKTLSSMLDDVSGDDDFYLTKLGTTKDPYQDNLNESDSIQTPSLTQIQREKRQKMLLQERKRPRHSLPSMLRTHGAEELRRVSLELEQDRRRENVFDDEEDRAGKDAVKKSSYSPVQVSKRRRVEVTPKKVELEPEEEIELDLPEPSHTGEERGHDENQPTLEDDHDVQDGPVAEPEIDVPEPSKPEEPQEPKEPEAKLPRTPSEKAAVDFSMDDLHMAREATPSPPTVTPSSLPHPILKPSSSAAVPVTPQPHTYPATPTTSTVPPPTTPNLFTVQDLTTILQETNRGVLEAISQMNQALAQKDANTAVLANALTSSTKYMQDLSTANGQMFSVFSENSRRMTEAMAENNKVMMELLKNNMAQQQAQPQSPVAQIQPDHPQHLPASPMNPPQPQFRATSKISSIPIQLAQPTQELEHQQQSHQQHMSMPDTTPLQASHTSAVSTAAAAAAADDDDDDDDEVDGAPVFDALTLEGIYAVTADAPAELAAPSAGHDHGNADDDEDVVMASPASPELGGGMSPVPHAHPHEDQELAERLVLETEQGPELGVTAHENGHQDHNHVELAQRLVLETEQEVGKTAEDAVRETVGEELGEPATPGADEEEGEDKNDGKSLAG